jgi:hypothetical protein
MSPCISASQLKNGLTLFFVCLVDAGATATLFITREGFGTRGIQKLFREVASLDSATTFKGGTGDLLALLCGRAFPAVCLCP